jgi:hypothetical protein
MGHYSISPNHAVLSYARTNDACIFADPATVPDNNSPLESNWLMHDWFGGIFITMQVVGNINIVRRKNIVPDHNIAYSRDMVAVPEDTTLPKFQRSWNIIDAATIQPTPALHDGFLSNFDSFSAINPKRPKQERTKTNYFE